MKHVYFFTLICLVSFKSSAQNHAFQLVLEDSNIGSVIYTGCQECSYESNDTGLNEIFLNHNVNWYQDAYPYAIGSFFENVKYVGCDGCDASQFLEDLNNYSQVIKIASLDNENSFFNHGLSLKLVDDSVGIPIGVSRINRGVVLTNNSDLNQIFSDYQVSIFQIVNEGSAVWERYELFCNCDAVQLKQELGTIPSVVSSSEYLFMGLLLSAPQFKSEKIQIYPNPFENDINIKLDTNFDLERIALYDVLGKKIYESSSISTFENYAVLIKSGVYLLKLTDDKGKSVIKKVIKS